MPFKQHAGVVVPFDRSDVDTDLIIPARFLKRIERTGYGQFLFASKRYRDDGTPDPDFVLNRPEYREGTVLVAGRNFGCGSSVSMLPGRYKNTDSGWLSRRLLAKSSRTMRRKSGS